MFSRYEYKYRLEEPQVEAVKAMANFYLDRDPFDHSKGYCVCSLYFDTPNWGDARASFEGLHRRSKLRLRTYGDPESSPLFLEQKSKVGDWVEKARIKTHGNDLHELLESAENQELRENLEAFILKRQMEPKLWVRYRREAWVSPDADRTRLTLDYDVEVCPVGRNHELLPPAEGWTFAEPDPRAILELKFDQSPPSWMLDFVERFGLYRTAMSKYGRGVESLPRAETGARGGTFWKTS